MIGFNNLGNMGRLGNQMFEYAALRGIAANKKYDWCIPPFNIKGNSTEKPIKSIQQIASITITGGSREKMETLGITV